MQDVDFDVLNLTLYIQTSKLRVLLAYHIQFQRFKYRFIKQEYSIM